MSNRTFKARVKLFFASFFALILSVGLILFSPNPATADDAPPPTVWQTWIMPNDGTDWPQLEASEENLAALPCGTTWRIQNDEYLPAERDRFVADGILHYGEDFGNEYQRGAISWFFSEHVTAPCVPEQPADEPYATSSQSVPDCVTRTVSTQTVTGFYGFALVDNVWVRNPEPTITSDVTTTREATAEECPMVEEPPVVIPCEKDDSCYGPDIPDDEPVITTATTSLTELPKTGPQDEANQRTAWIAGVGGVLGLVGLIFLGIRFLLRRPDDEDERTTDQ